MTRDARRGRGVWRGCPSAKDLVVSETGRGPKRNAALQMGHDYYYYYEVNGDAEIYDAAQPSTTFCPFLPGQTVNILSIPEERRVHHRTASTSQLAPELYFTMNPDDKFAPTHSAAQMQADSVAHRLRTASAILSRRTSSRSPSPTAAAASSWKRFFSKRYEEDRGRPASRGTVYTPVFDEDRSVSSRSQTPSDGTRTRDISPESLRRFLCDEDPVRPASNLEVRHPLAIPEDIAEEEDDDDDNFASSEIALPAFATRLSPPPSHRATSSSTSVATITKLLPRLNTTRLHEITSSSAIASPADDVPAFDDSEGDHSNDEDSSLVKQRLPFSYRLPRQSFDRKLGGASPEVQTHSPKLLAKSNGAVTFGVSAGLLGSPAEECVEDFAWMVGAISTGP
ncbi:hypothetical protein VHEMI04487 [[Torrubiella] hemipterigena]|nr:hypothetical protein VHEMI04487 [[Torrubiella] hemipterigena]